MTDDFAQFFASTCAGMLAKAILLSGHRQEAEDAVQEAYTEALRAWHRIAGYDSPEAWVYKVMSQRLWAASRRASRQTPSGLDLKVPAPAQAGPERTAEARAVIAALAALPGKMRFVMVMHCLNGMSQEQVAAELGLARSTVAVYLHSARRLLEKTLDMAPARQAGQPLVWVPAPPGTAGPAEGAVDPFGRGLRAAGHWLAEGLAGAADVGPAIGAAVAAAVANDGARRPGAWRRWRQRGRTQTAAP
jgi:RNA polymerase sigma-70 factor (ECF subfamily)